MQLLKSITKSKNLSESIEKDIITDINTIASALIDKYTIYSDSTKVSQKELVDFITDMYQFEVNKKQCAGVTKIGQQCINNAYKSSKYCKKHIKLGLTYTPFSKMTQESIVFLERGNQQHEQIKQKEKKLEKVFIEDSFYFIDEHYIYNVSDNEKVGYIDDNKNYVFTSDPFVLNEW